jgi:hypothetical protein
VSTGPIGLLGMVDAGSRASTSTRVTIATETGAPQRAVESFAQQVTELALALRHHDVEPCVAVRRAEEPSDLRSVAVDDQQPVHQRERGDLGRDALDRRPLGAHGEVAGGWGQQVAPDGHDGERRCVHRGVRGASSQWSTMAPSPGWSTSWKS